MTYKKGFTLVELLVVIAILAVLATVVVLVLNPAQLLAEARDSQRISDLGTIQKALTLYLVNVSTPSMGNTANCYTHIDVDAAGGGGCAGRHGTKTELSDLTREVTGGAGWLPVDFGQISSGAPFSVLPIDPSNTTTYFYSYTPGANSTFELNANMESTKYSSGVTNVEDKDGGSSTTLFELGSSPGLVI